MDYDFLVPEKNFHLRKNFMLYKVSYLVLSSLLSSTSPPPSPLSLYSKQIKFLKAYSVKIYSPILNFSLHIIFVFTYIPFQ